MSGSLQTQRRSLRLICCSTDSESSADEGAGCLTVNMFSVTGWRGRCVQERFQCTDAGGPLQQNHLTQSYAGQLLSLMFYVSLHCRGSTAAYTVRTLSAINPEI